jgi:hypothetical protein
METWRCPTCLTVLLESTAKRCPACQTKLRRRGQPIVLGETSRLVAQSTLPKGRQTRERLGRGHWNAERPAPTSAAFERTEFEPWAWRVTEPVVAASSEAAPWVDESEPYPFFEELGAETVAAPVREAAAPRLSGKELTAALADDVNSLVDGLHRKARSRRR